MRRLGKCENCEAQRLLTAKRRGRLVLDLCRHCELRDVIGMWRQALRGQAA